MERGNLILMRRKGETVHIGADIEIEIVSIRQGQVQLSFRAPKSVDIWRGELGVSRETSDHVQGQLRRMGFKGGTP